NLLHRVWPVLLIIAGAYLVGSYYRGGRAPQAKAVYQTPPPSAVTPSLDPGARDLAGTQYPERELAAPILPIRPSNVCRLLATAGHREHRGNIMISLCPL